MGGKISRLFFAILFLGVEAELLNGCHRYSIYDFSHENERNSSAKLGIGYGRNQYHTNHGWFRFRIRTDVGTYDGKIKSSCSNRIGAPICGMDQWRWIEDKIPYNGSTNSYLYKQDLCVHDQTKIIIQQCRPGYYVYYLQVTDLPLYCIVPTSGSIIDQDDAKINHEVKWRAEKGPYFITSSMTIGTKGILTIEEGTRIVSAEGISITVHGRLIIQGSELQRVAIGTNGKQWQGIIIHHTMPLITQLSYLDLYHAGGSKTPENAAAITARGSKLIINNVAITDSFGNGIALHGANMTIHSSKIINSRKHGLYLRSNSNIAVVDCRIANNGGYGMKSLDIKANIHLERNIFNSNSMGAIEVIADQGIISNNVIINHNISFPHHLLSASFSRTSSFTDNNISHNIVNGKKSWMLYLGSHIQYFQRNTIVYNTADIITAIFVQQNVINATNNIFNNFYGSFELITFNHHYNPVGSIDHIDKGYIDARYCYWGSRDILEIAKRIHDFNDDNQLPPILFRQFRLNNATDSATATTSSSTVIYHFDAIVNHERWLKNKYHVIPSGINLAVWYPGQLTIAPGCQVRFNHQSKMIVYGSIQAQGDNNTRIVFMPNINQGYKNKLNDNHDHFHWQLVLQNGFFRYVSFLRGSNNMIDIVKNYVEFTYCQLHGAQGNALLLRKAKLNISHSLIEKNHGYGIQIQNPIGTSYIDDCLLRWNQGGIHISGRNEFQYSQVWIRNNILGNQIGNQATLAFNISQNRMLTLQKEAIQPQRPDIFVINNTLSHNYIFNHPVIDIFLAKGIRVAFNFNYIIHNIAQGAPIMSVNCQGVGKWNGSQFNNNQFMGNMAISVTKDQNVANKSCLGVTICNQEGQSSYRNNILLNYHNRYEFADESSLPYHDFIDARFSYWGSHNIIGISERINDFQQRRCGYVVDFYPYAMDKQLMPITPEFHIHDRDIDQDETWNSTRPHLIYRSIRLHAKAVLHILDGATIYFYPTTAMRIDGKIIANGTKRHRIRFTSFLGRRAHPGDWQQLSIHSKFQSLFSYCDFGYGGLSSAMVKVTDLSAAFYQCTFAYSLHPLLQSHRSICQMCSLITVDPNKFQIESNDIHVAVGSDVPLHIHFIGTDAAWIEYCKIRIDGLSSKMYLSYGQQINGSWFLSCQQIRGNDLRLYANDQVDQRLGSTVITLFVSHNERMIARSWFSLTLITDRNFTTTAITNEYRNGTRTDHPATTVVVIITVCSIILAMGLIITIVTWMYFRYGRRFPWQRMDKEHEEVHFNL
ncbi:hypothetical protein TrispH2_010370 [Trichoplax sp. H2]|nr:hypothetical protein TrispH2_010370 [Trichoplax sp. H2]|eukprot:RDD37119.1 hypothetical protein TrispH2_010370 [Trichoplax sp. H2]